MKTYLKRGKLVIPAETVNALGIMKGDNLDIEVKNGKIIIQNIDAEVRRLRAKRFFEQVRMGLALSEDDYQKARRDGFNEGYACAVENIKRIVMPEDSHYEEV